MRNIRHTMTQDELKSILHYDPDTGIWTWLINHRSVSKGSTAGYRNVDGYWIIIYKDKRYRAHRLAFLYMTGKLPIDEVDHKNEIKDDNKWKNLRECTGQQNKHNRNYYKGNI